jgi:hypothetical protein
LVGTITTVLPVLPRSPFSPSAPVAPVAPVYPVEPVFPVFPVAPVLPVAPVSPFFVSPVAPVAPAGPAGPGTATTVGDGATTTGLSHALNPSVASSATDNIEYLMIIPLVWVTEKCALIEFLWIEIARAGYDSHPQGTLHAQPVPYVVAHSAVLLHSS